MAQLAEEYFETRMAADPFLATQLGVPGYDMLVPDPSRVAVAELVGRLESFRDRLAAIPVDGLGGEDRISHVALGHTIGATIGELGHGLLDIAVTASAVGQQIVVFQVAQATSVSSDEQAEHYLARVRALSGFVDGWTDRYAGAAASGRPPTALGVRQTMEQLDRYLASDLDSDTLVRPLAGFGEPWRRQCMDVVAGSVRPALQRMRDRIEAELLPVGRGDDAVGACHVPGGSEAYADAVRRHTTTDRLDPEQVHRIGLETLAELREEFADIGQRAFGLSDFTAVRDRLRGDPALRFQTSAEILQFVTDALSRAERALPDWLTGFDVAPCVVEEIPAFEAPNAPLAYYRPPAGDGSRPGAHCVVTSDPETRFRYEYEAIAFHESVPGHHLQIAAAQTLTDLPRFRQYVEGQVTAYVEGWGLYCERLADEMGLYSSDVQRLGMLSFDALRACRLVVDTGMHHYGWSRTKAIEFMRANTATTEANIANEIDRYIAWPGQATGYLIGRRELVRIRAEARRRLGAAFDVKAFHAEVLGHGALPLDVLADVVAAWDGAPPS